MDHNQELLTTFIFKEYPLNTTWRKREEIKCGGLLKSRLKVFALTIFAGIKTNFGLWKGSFRSSESFHICCTNIKRHFQPSVFASVVTWML